MGGKKVRVGVVDDNRSVAEIISEVLGSRDFECFDAYDGRGAIELAKTRNLDILILDFALPDIDGLEVVRRIEAMGKSLPTVIITGMGSDPPGGWSSTSSVRAVIRKPFTAGELRRRVAEITGHVLP